MQISRVNMGYSEKKVSPNAVFATGLGAGLIGVQILMMILSIVNKGNLPFASGVVESYILLFSVFGILWAVTSLDEEKTLDKFKIPGIVLNAVALILAIFVMVIGFLAY